MPCVRPEGSLPVLHLWVFPYGLKILFHEWSFNCVSCIYLYLFASNMQAKTVFPFYSFQLIILHYLKQLFCVFFCLTFYPHPTEWRRISKTFSFQISIFFFRFMKRIFSWPLTVLYSLVMGGKKKVGQMFGQHLHLEEEHETSITVQQHWQQPQMTTGLIRPFHCSAGLLCLPWKTFDWK